MMMLNPLRVMVTSSGCPGASTLLRHLKKIEKREIITIGIDSEAHSIGRYFADEFHQVPLANNSLYIESVLSIAQKTKANCILVSSSLEVEVLAQYHSLFAENGIKLLASSPESLAIANNKRRLYELFKNHPQVKVPDFTVVNTLSEFISACEKMGYPARKLCFKPPVSKGSRGFRFLSDSIDRADLLLNYKPDSKIISLAEMISIFEDRSDFPELLIMETVEGEEIDTMVLADAGEALLITHKTRESERGGVITRGMHVDRPDIDLAIHGIFSQVKLSHNIGVQFKGGKLIEINPRLSTFLYTQDWVEPYFAIQYALGELTADQVRAKQHQVPKSLRMLRYFDQVFDP